MISSFKKPKCDLNFLINGGPNFFEEIKDSKFKQFELYCCICKKITSLDLRWFHHYDTNQLCADLICYDCGSIGKLYSSSITFPYRYPDESYEILFDHKAISCCLIKIYYFPTGKFIRTETIFEKQDIQIYFENLAILT